MTFVYLFLFTASSFFTLYNINSLITFVNNFNRKLKLNVAIILYFVCSTAYILCRMNRDKISPVIEPILWIVYYILLIVNLIIVNKCSFKRLMYISFLYLSLDSIIQSLFRYICSIVYSEYAEQSIQLFTMFLSSIIIYFALKMLIKCNSGFLLGQINLIPNYVYVLILLALFFSGGLIENQLLVTNHTEFQTMFNKTFTIISIFLLLFIIGLLVFNCISRAYFENVSSILEKQVNEQVDYYKKIDKIDKDLRDFRHDYKNHMICVQSLIEAKEYDEATEYLEGITLHKTILSRGFSSGNSIADVLLSDKSEWAEKVGAKIQFEGVIYENIPPADLCTILSNAIDNAIEACEKIQSDEKKIISVKCSYIKRIQFIDITNPVSEDVKITNNVVETSKSDKNIHGIGLYNIRRTVMKYDGEFEISCKDKTFAMSIAFKAD